jgi:hypothetical protein
LGLGNVLLAVVCDLLFVHCHDFPPSVCSHSSLVLPPFSLSTDLPSTALFMQEPVPSILAKSSSSLGQGRKQIDTYTLGEFNNTASLPLLFLANPPLNFDLPPYFFFSFLAAK